MGDAVVRVRGPVSERVLRAVGPFGLLVRSFADGTRETEEEDADRRRTAAELLDAAPDASCTLLTGPSGCGKTRLLRSVTEEARRRCLRVVEVSIDGSQPLPDRAALDLFVGVPDAAALSAMARAGLAEARLLARRATELSAGEAARLRVAIAMADAERAAREGWAPRGGGVPPEVRRGAVLLVVDEFASLLDRTTARGVASAFVRWVSRTPGVRTVAASAHEDVQWMAEWARVVKVENSEQRSSRTADRSARRRPLRGPAAASSDLNSAAPISAVPSHAITIEPGSLSDFHRLAHLHYISGRPATVTRVLRAIAQTPLGEELAGVLVVSVPTLNGAWRSLAWPRRFSTGDKRADALRVSRELRCVSRVVVDPRFRACGLASRLVRTYLDSPQTPLTEAVAAMGNLCPFFERAGMTPYALPPSAADLRLRDAIEHAGLDPSLIADTRVARRLPADPLTARELAAWAKAKRVRASSPTELALLAARRLNANPIAYAHTHT